MKKIINKIYTLFAASLLLANAAIGQLPLQQGDAVITHSQNNMGGSGGSIVLRVVKASNTSTAPLGASWNTSTMSCPTPGTKPGNWNATNWTQGVLGNIFGITLDDQPVPNIYVSSSQIYSGSVLNASKIWRLNGTTGANSLVFDFLNTTRSLGNLKYLKAGSTENIYVSNWDNGFIQRLNGNSSGTALWANQTPFNPKFGLPIDNVNFLPYGIGIRNIGTGSYRLYYAKINLVSPFNTNEIWSVNLNAAGDFIPASEQQEVFPTAELTTYSGTVISDISFTSDGKKMLVGQQTFLSFGKLCSHRSNVAEFIAQLIDHNWAASPNIFHAGQGSGFGSSCGGMSGDWNCVGGVSYSNNILKGTASAVSCESTVWFSSDAIVFGSCFAYGIQGMNANGGALNSVSNSVIIDADDYTISGDKMQLGDVEVFRLPICNPCGCGHWSGNPTLNGEEITGQSIIHIADGALQNRETEIQREISTKIILKDQVIESKLSKSVSGAGPIGPIVIPQNYPIQFVQGNVSGLINATYLCNGDCGATYTWEIKNDATAAMVANGTALPVDLAVYNNQLKCGKYTLVIKAKCGASNCESLVIPITIICEPVNCCKAQIDISLEDHAIYAAANIPNPNAYSIANLNFMLNYSLPMSEVRVSVEEFQLKANSPNCLNCNNRPVTWGNILNASLNGTPMPLSGTVAPPTGSLPADYREAVYNVGTPLAPSSAGLSLQLSLPAVTELSCCEVKAYVCLKFTFKDTQCRECVQMVCGEVKLIPKNNPHVDNPKDKIEIKKFNVNH